MFPESFVALGFVARALVLLLRANLSLLAQGTSWPEAAETRPIS